MKTRDAIALALLVAAALAGCSRSGSQGAAGTGKESAMQQAIADTLAEEREKDRQMRAAAAAAASEEVSRVEGESVQEARVQTAAQAPTPPVDSKSDSAETLRTYTERLQESVGDPATMQVRNAAMAPNRNGMCAEFSARDKHGVYAGFKRVIVTDSAVNPEEPAYKETLNGFLAFQTAARETGCFADVLNVRVVR